MGTHIKLFCILFYVNIFKYNNTITNLTTGYKIFVPLNRNPWTGLGTKVMYWFRYTKSLYLYIKVKKFSQTQTYYYMYHPMEYMNNPGIEV